MSALDHLASAQVAPDNAAQATQATDAATSATSALSPAQAAMRESELKGARQIDEAWRSAETALDVSLWRSLVIGTTRNLTHSWPTALSGAIYAAIENKGRVYGDLELPTIALDMLRSLEAAGELDELVAKLSGDDCIIPICWQDSKGRARTFDTNFHSLLKAGEIFLRSDGARFAISHVDAASACKQLHASTGLALLAHVRGDLDLFARIYVKTYKTFLEDLEKHCGGGFFDAAALRHTLNTVVRGELGPRPSALSDTATIGDARDIQPIKAARAAVKNFLAYHDYFRQTDNRPWIWDQIQDPEHTGLDAAARSPEFARYDFGEKEGSARKNATAGAILTGIVFGSAMEYADEMAKRYAKTVQRAFTIIDCIFAGLGWATGYAQAHGVPLQSAATVAGTVAKYKVGTSKSGEAPAIRNDLKLFLDTRIKAPARDGRCVPGLDYKDLRFVDDAESQLRCKLGEVFLGVLGDYSS